MDIGFLGALQIALIVMKLCGAITWAWIWVLAPLWAVDAAILVVVAALAILWGRK